jgi:hypothetical protein
MDAENPDNAACHSGNLGMAQRGADLLVRKNQK